MIITAKANGDILNIKPSVFYQGSTEANKIYLIAPFAINSSVSVGFTLPNTSDIAVTLMTPSTSISDELNTWVYDVPVAITQYVGIVKVNISIVTPSGTTITLNRCQFEVKRGDEVVLPDEPEADVYAQIVQALADIYANFINKVDTSYIDTENDIEQGVINNSNGLKLVKTVGDVTVTFEVTENGIEIDGLEINTNIENRIATHNTSGTAHSDIRLIAETAETNSEEAVATADEAKATADGIDAKAQTALDNSEEAVETANEAKAIALSKTNNKSFDTYAEMIAYISDADNKSLHTVGSSFFIVDTEVPDYWVTETLTTPNESGYYYVLEEAESSVLSVNGQTGEVVLDADDIDDTDTTNKFVTSEQLAQISTNTGDITDLQDEKVDKANSSDYYYTSGLVFTYSSTGGDHYIVSGYTGEDTILYIPKYYDDGTHGILKVTSVANIISAAPFPFENITDVYLPDTISKFNCHNWSSIKNISYKGIINSVHFYGCSDLEYINLPDSIETLLTLEFLTNKWGAFQNCSSIKYLDIPAGVTVFGDKCFKGCSNLIELTVRSLTPPTLGTEVFTDSGITASTGAVYVKSSSVAAYKVASGWSDIADRIFAIPDGELIQDIIDDIDAIETNYITTDTDQDITGEKTFKDDVNIGVVGTAKNLNIVGDLNLTGDIIQEGSTYETHAEQIYSTKDEIILREGAVAGLATGAMAKITAKLYDGTNDGVLGFDKDGIARVGDVGTEQAIATREDTPIDDGVARWDAATSKFVTETPDSTPTASSTKVVTSGGVKAALDLKATLANTNTFSGTNNFSSYVNLNGATISNNQFRQKAQFYTSLPTVLSGTQRTSYKKLFTFTPTLSVPIVTCKFNLHNYNEYFNIDCEFAARGASSLFTTFAGTVKEISNTNNILVGDVFANITETGTLEIWIKNIATLMQSTLTIESMMLQQGCSFALNEAADWGSAPTGTVTNFALSSSLRTIDVINDLTTGGTTVPLSAEQGKTLNTNKLDKTTTGDTRRVYGVNASNAQELTEIVTSAVENSTDLITSGAVYGIIGDIETLLGGI